MFLDAADVVLAKRRISDVATMLHLRHAIYFYCVHPPSRFGFTNFNIPSPHSCSHVTFRRILMNIAWATLYNFLMIPLAAGALYPRCAASSSSVPSVAFRRVTELVHRPQHSPAAIASFSPPGPVLSPWLPAGSARGSSMQPRPNNASPAVYQ